MSRVVIFDRTGQPDVLHIVDEPAKEPSAGEVRVRIEAIGVNRLDHMMRTGAFPRPFRLPHARIGCEGTGIVDALGSEVDGFAEGDPVIITAVPAMDVDGTYADQVVVPADRLIRRPEGLTAVDGAALWVSYSTAYGALVEKAGMRPGDTVLITAASSSVGLAALQVARQIGAVPLATTRTSAKRELLLEAGAAAVFASEEGDVAAAAREFTGGAGVDIIMDAVAGPGVAALATAAKPGGCVVLVGWMDARPASMPTNAPLTIYRYMSFEHTLDPIVVRRMAAFLDAGLRLGALRPRVDSVFALEDVVAAHRRLDEGAHVGKIVLTT
ncbi:MAG TPA: zinc-dependent alcohol dehydrogenase family protein [Flexivirga sp.]|uniref:zinc-dependent alcohol dehydrogenase family protein n=1 Tax=Flexivirga sp. TaxID=1962927 RepID=UPI002BD5D51D|nr:zinc-dependent alcohol dehydrogenase family protein [Flexivirga sp.]HWC21822.1 zinc-dependent alcohol dehydrogenase family protein [Flexivirga sp.]